MTSPNQLQRQKQRKRFDALFFVAVLLFVFSLVGAAYAASWIDRKDDNVAIARADPSGTSDGTGGYSATRATWGQDVTAVWVVLDAEANNITACSCMLWHYDSSADVQWGADLEAPITCPVGFNARIWRSPVIEVEAVGRYFWKCTVTLSAGTTVDYYNRFRLGR